MQIVASSFDVNNDWSSTKLVGIHAQEILNVFRTFGKFKSTFGDFDGLVTVCWDETNDVNSGNIKRYTKKPNKDQLEMIFSGPHIYVAQPFYKTPKEECVKKSDYDTIDLQLVSEDYRPRTNYIPGDKSILLSKFIKGFDAKDNWLDHYKVGFRKMLSNVNERTLTSCLIPPSTSHVNGIISVTFKDEQMLTEFAGLTHSIAYDFYVKSIGASNLTDSRLRPFPMGIDKKYQIELIFRTLLLNCVNEDYAGLWERLWNDAFKESKWSKNTAKLSMLKDRTRLWVEDTPLRNWYERRLALIEIDVITAMALGLSLEELALIYNVQFPVLQQNENDTWYDTKGNIVFTCAKGIPGIGLDRPIWNDIKNLKVGETYEHTIEKSELYKGKVVTYHAPFDKCDRVEDYKTAWAHFEEIFKEEG